MNAYGFDCKLWVRVELYLEMNMLGSMICEIVVICCDPCRCGVLLPDGIV